MTVKIKRIKFTCVVEITEKDFEGFNDPEECVDTALTYGDNHQAFWSSHMGDITVEDVESDV